MVHDLETTSHSVLKTDALRIGYGDVALLPPISFNIETGQHWALLGPNGAGKSTLVRTLLNMMPPVSGAFTISDNVGYVPQRSSINDLMPVTVNEMIAEGYDRGWSFVGRRKVPSEELEAVMRETDTIELRDQQFARLSEGQKQRVLMAKAIVGRPKLLLLDEPSSAMDRKSAIMVFELLQALEERHGLASVVVSHQLDLALEYATHIIALDKDQDFLFCGTLEEATHNQMFMRHYSGVLKVAT